MKVIELKAIAEYVKKMYDEKASNEVILAEITMYADGYRGVMLSDNAIILINGTHDININELD